MNASCTLSALAGVVLVASACSTSGPASPAQTPSSDLAGTSWRLVQFRGGDDQVLTPDDRSKYTVRFNADGTVAVRLDCNRGRGTWKSPEGSQLELGQLALTRAMCPQMTLHDQMARQWTFIRSYVIRSGHLFLSLMADGGIYELEPMKTETS
jgi:para-nitrobenzyl esterase